MLMLKLVAFDLQILLVSIWECSGKVMLVHNHVRVDIFGYFFLFNQSFGNLVVVIGYLVTLEYLCCSFRLIVKQCEQSGVESSAWVVVSYRLNAHICLLKVAFAYECNKFPHFLIVTCLEVMRHKDLEFAKHLNVFRNDLSILIVLW